MTWHEQQLIKLECLKLAKEIAAARQDFSVEQIVKDAATIHQFVTSS